MKKYYFAVVIATLAVASACRKKEAPSSTPSLSAPNKAFPSAERSNAPSYIKPEAEATASGGPIQLTFRLYKKSAKAVKSDTSIWGQIELKNVGKKKFLILDDVFYEPRRINDVSESRAGIYVEILDSQDKRVKVYRYWRDAIVNGGAPTSPSTPEQAAESKKVDAMIAGWRQQGLSLMEIRDRLLDYSRNQPNRDEAEKWKRRVKDARSDLFPGQSVTTMPWAHSPALFKDTPPGKPIGQFTELTDYDLKPGHYRIHAVYDCAPSGRIKSKYPPLDFEVRVETPYIPFDVVR